MLHIYFSLIGLRLGGFCFVVFFGCFLLRWFWMQVLCSVWFACCCVYTISVILRICCGVIVDDDVLFVLLNLNVVILGLFGLLFRLVLLIVFVFLFRCKVVFGRWYCGVVCNWFNVGVVWLRDVGIAWWLSVFCIVGSGRFVLMCLRVACLFCLLLICSLLHGLFVSLILVVFVGFRAVS